MKIGGETSPKEAIYESYNIFTESKTAISQVKHRFHGIRQRFVESHSVFSESVGILQRSHFAESYGVLVKTYFVEKSRFMKADFAEKNKHSGKGTY